MRCLYQQGLSTAGAQRLRAIRIASIPVTPVTNETATDQIRTPGQTTLTLR